MSELKGAKSLFTEEEELRNLLKVRDTIDDILHELEDVVNATQTDLFYVTAHQINETYSKILDEVMEVPNFTISSNNYDNKDSFVWNRQYVRSVDNVDKTVGKCEDLRHSEDESEKTFSLQQLFSKPDETPTLLVSLEKNVDFEGCNITLKQTGSISSQKTKTCDDSERYFSRIEEFSLSTNKSDSDGTKRLMPSSPEEDQQVDDRILNKSPRSLCKKRKVEFCGEVFNEVIMQQKRSINMDVKLARENFRGPMGIPTDSIAVILNTEKPATSYKYPIIKPEYEFSRMPLGKLNKAGQKVCLTVYSTKEYRKIRAYPYVDDYIELTDAFLTKELDEEYNKIVHSECSKIMEEERNFFNSPNRTITLMESNPGSSTEDSCQDKLNANFLDSAKFLEKTRQKQDNNFRENTQKQNYEKTLPTNQKNLWYSIDHPPSYQTELKMQDSMLFSDIVPLQSQTYLGMLNIRKHANCEEEQFFNNNIKYSEFSETMFYKSKPCDIFNVSSSQLNTSSDKINTNESISDELPVCSPSKLTPFTSPVSRTDTSLINFESDMPFSDVHKEDRNDKSKTLGTDDVEGEYFMSIFKDKTLLNKEPANTVHVLEKFDKNVGSVVLPVQTVELDNNIEIISSQINAGETNTLNIDQNFSPYDEDFVLNNLTQMNEIDDDNASFGSDDISIAESISTISVNDFDNECGGKTTDSNKTVIGNFAFVSTEPCTHSMLENSKENHIKSSLNNQNSNTFINRFNDSVQQNASGNVNIQPSVFATYENFKDVSVVTEAIESVEENILNSSHERDEDIVIVSELNTADATNTPDFKKENIPTSIKNKDDYIAFMSDPDNEKNMSCKIDNYVDKQNKITGDRSDSNNDFSSHDHYKKGYVTKFDDGDIINLSDSSTCSNNEVILIDNIIPYRMRNVKEEYTSKCPINQHDIYNFSLNNNGIPYNTTALKTNNVAEAEDIIELSSSSNASIISVVSDNAFFYAKEKSATASFPDDIILCDSSDTSTTASISSSNHNSSSLIDYSTNFRNYKVNNQIFNISDNTKDEILSSCNRNIFSSENMPNKTNKKNNSNEENIKPTLDVIDFSNKKNFSFANENLPYSKSQIDNFFTETLDDQIEDGITSAGSTNSKYVNKDTVFSKYTNISENVPQSSAAPIENYGGGNTTTPSDFFGNSNMDISDIDVDEKNEPVAAKTFGNFQENINYRNQNFVAASDNRSTSSYTPRFFFSCINFNNSITSNICCSKNILSSTAETFENIDEYNVSIPCADGQEDESISASNNSIRINGNDDIDPCKSEDFYLNIPDIDNFKGMAQSSLLDYNESIRPASITSTACNAERSTNGVSSIVDDPCASNYVISFNGTNISSDHKISSTNFTNKNVATLSNEGSSTSGNNTIATTETNAAKHSLDYHNDGTSASNLINADTYLPTSNLFTVANIPTLRPLEEHQSKSSNNQNNIESVIITRETVGFENDVNPTIISKSSTIEQLGKYLASLSSPHCSNQNISNVVSTSIVNSSSDINVEICENADLKFQNNIPKVDLSFAFDSKSETLKKTAPLASEKTENTTTNTKKLLELPHVNSEIGVRPSLLNEASHNVPNLNLDNTSRTYVPITNINAEFVPQCNSRNLDVIQNCTITSSEYFEVDKTAEKFTKNDCDNSEKELKTSPKISDLKVQTNSLLVIPLNIPTSTVSLISHDKHCTETRDRSSTAVSTSKAPVHSTYTTNVSKITTGVKRPPPSTNTNESNKKRYKSSSSNNLIKQTKPSTSKNDASVNDYIDTNEIADNNDPKWKLYSFSEPRDFFMAVHNQWCMPIPNPHLSCTRRHYHKKPNNNPTNYIIHGNQRDLKIKCLELYEEQLHKVNTESTNLKYALDMHGQYWNQRHINYTIEKLRKLDRMHDMLRQAWDDAYQFYTYLESIQSAWYMSTYKKNEIMRSIQMLDAYENYYGSSD